MRCCTVCSCGAWIGLLGVGLLCIGLAAGAEAAGRGAGGRGRIQPAVLRCEYAHNPLGIDVRQPRLSWILEAGSRAVRGEEQTAYQVLVGTDEARLRANRPDLWNSGKVLGRNSVHVPYSGKPLRAGVRAFWKVRVWDRQGNPSEFSPLAWWEMGLLEPRDWRATWITRGDAPPASDRELFEENPAPLFRRELNLTKSVARARAYVSGLGYYELRINGARVGDQVLDPGWTTYSRRVLYSTYDVTSLLRRGRNALGMMLGNGWYNPLPLRMWNSINLREHLPVGQPRAILHLEVEYTDGTRETVGTDKSWRAGDGPILKNSVYLGELYDARREQPGWDQPGFDDSQWRAAAPAREEVGPLRAQTAPPIRVSSVIRPIAVTEPKPGVFIVDMGENFAGWVQLRVRGEAGAKVTLRYGELLYPDGTLNPMTSVAGQIKGVRGNPAVGAPETAWQTDAYILKGGGDESYTPRFTFHGFRYVELTGYPGAPTLDTLRGLRLNSSVDRAGAFACSNPLLNRIQDMVIRTQLSNMFSVQSDCPHREKFAYGGDIVATSEMAILNFDMARFYAKTVRDHHDAARPNGGLTETAPFVGIADSGLGGGAGPVEWGTAHPLLLWQMYQYYGDRRLLAEQYETARRWVALIQSQAKGHILDNGLSDHESLVPKPVPLTGTAFYYLNVQLLARIAGVLGHTADAERYSALAGSIREAFNQRFLQAGAGRYGPGTQVSQAAALYLGLVPPTEQRAALGVLKADVLETHKGHLSTGIFGTKFLLHTLSDHGMSDVAYTVVNQRDFPGWGHMLERGATTLWEHWEFSDNTFSHNHPMFGSVSEWFYKDLAGIRPGPAAVG
ncbi:MAG TPA: family 78 glycoside hydrolase catalytic domain, partial [Armatimonadota bacterium]|nr:family 78 glycoside hydrolase catalytic domain [Armatimonadota bacterium]